MIYKKGNIINALEKGEIDVILHQCNCFGIGAGVAKAIVEVFPEVNRADIDYRKNTMPFATSLAIKLKGNGGVVNIYSQYRPGPCRSDGIDTYEIRKEALAQCLKFLPDAMKEMRIGIPLIASGLAADLNLKGVLTDLDYFSYYIQDVFETHLSTSNITVYYL